MVKTSTKLRRKNRVRKKLKSISNDKYRLSVFRSSKHIYAQIIDDASGRTLVSASSLDKENKLLGNNLKSAATVGSIIAKLATDAGINEVYFDRGNYKFHGRIKALADGARESGLNF
tara:strand:- start:169 stop:519 length:351 start_codon:yes stop_codon:yes gene_type:complete